jgi:hypothetical protein
MRLLSGKEFQLLLILLAIAPVSSRAQDQFHDRSLSARAGAAPNNLWQEREYGEEPRYHLSGFLFLMGGADFPLSDFAATHSDRPGAARTGTSFGIGYSSTYAFPLGAEVSLTYTSNPVNSTGIVAQTGFPSPLPNTSGSWTFFTPLLGLRLGAELAGIGVGIVGNGGLMFARTPDFTLTGDAGAPVRVSSSATAFAYGASLHIVPSHYVSFIIQGLSAKPEFSASASGSSVRFTQPMTNLQLFICLGM